MGALKAAFRNDITDDLLLIQLSVMMVGAYAIGLLGSCSPVHCRSIVGAAGLMCVVLAYTSGFGICLTLGWKIAGVHNLMPFLIIGIGVDDFFVICNALD